MNRRSFLKSASLGSAALVANWGPISYAADSNPLHEGLESFQFHTVTIDDHGKVIRRREHEAQYFSQHLGGHSGESTRIEMVAIPATRYKSGSSLFESRRGTYESMQRQIAVKPMFMSKTLITQAQWRAVSRMPKVSRDLLPNPAHFKGDLHPVESVSWLDATEFCVRLSNHTGMNYVLPDEAAWEGACRALTTSAFHFGQTVTSEHANFGAAYTYASEQPGLPRHATTPVGQYLPNAYGLYDMHGNVWEWCSDSANRQNRVGLTNNRSLTTGKQRELRVVRGGAWADEPVKLKSASRSAYAANSLNRMIGFRVSIKSA